MQATFREKGFENFLSTDQLSLWIAATPKEAKKQVLCKTNSCGTVKWWPTNQYYIKLFTVKETLKLKNEFLISKTIFFSTLDKESSLGTVLEIYDNSKWLELYKAWVRLWLSGDSISTNEQQRSCYYLTIEMVVIFTPASRCSIQKNLSIYLSNLKLPTSFLPNIFYIDSSKDCRFSNVKSSQNHWFVLLSYCPKILKLKVYLKQKPRRPVKLNKQDPCVKTWCTLSVLSILNQNEKFVEICEKKQNPAL